MSSSLFGWDLLYTSVVDDVKDNADVLVCFTHYVLISRGFSCIGIGDDKILDGNEQKSEKLPAGWNDGYALRYIFEGRMYHLRGMAVDDTIQINLIRIDERKISLVPLNLRMVLKKKGTIAEMIPNYQDIKGNIEKQLIEPVVTSDKNKHQQTQTPPEEPPKPLYKTDYIPPNASNPLMHPPRNPLLERGPIGVGMADLDPFFGGRGPFGPGIGIGSMGGPGGGGMLYPSPGEDPFGRRGPLPQRGVPPGARFDPFSPPDADGNQPRPRRNPGSDDFPPPEFGNMFM